MSQAPAAAPGLERELLRLAVRVAAEAGQLLAERFAAGSERPLGSKSSPTDLVSQADVDAERLIREALARARPDDGLVGEEGSARRGSSGLEWVVDPLDGTVNFLLGIPQWCVSVAVRDARGALAGAICDPVRGEVFSATRCGPALLGGMDDTGAGGSPRALGDLPEGSDESSVALPRARACVRVRAGDLGDAMIATGFAYLAEVRAAQAEVLARLLPRVRDIRRFGSAALDLAWTAAGRYDAYYERSVRPWDIAAGVLICERAGLRSVELPRAGVLPWGVLVASPGLVEALHEIVG